MHGAVKEQAVTDTPAVASGSSATAQRSLRVLSNVRSLDGFQHPRVHVLHRLIPRDAGRWSAFWIFWQSFRCDVVVIDNNPPYLCLLCLLRWLWPFGTAPLVALDLILVKPVGWRQRLAAWRWRLLLRRVSHFIHYFKDWDGYYRYFGIPPERSSYVPFKVNHWEALPPAEELSADGDYIFAGGRSLRDVDTFVAAMRLLPYPGLLLYHDLELMQANGTRLDVTRLPANVRAVEDDGSEASWRDHLRRARVVVVTSLPDNLRAVGVSTWMLALALKKCVVVTESPATHGILSDQEALLVPPSDPAALAEAIRSAWEDDALRERLAVAGRRFAEKAGGEQRLLCDVLDICARVA